MLIRFLQFGPRYVRYSPIFQGGFDDYGPSPDGRVRSDSSGSGSIGASGSAPAPVALPTPITNAQELAGGLTSAQIDQAAQMEVEEGAAIPILYGELLVAGTLASHVYEAGTPRNTFTVVLGEGWGGLGRHGEWESIEKAWYLGEELTRRFDYTIWFSDKLPAGAIANPDSDGWNWIQKNPEPYFGKYSHQSPNKAGLHAHFFTDGAGLAIGTGDTISCLMWIDPVNTPQEIMIQFATGAGVSDFEHRAYWGANLITFGTNGTNSRRQISASIPPTGVWWRLDVLASAVGLEGQTVTGFGVALFDGATSFGQISRWKNTMSGNTGYMFRPGVIAPTHGDIQQAQDLTTWPCGTAGNGAANATIRLNTTQSAQDRPDGFKCRAKCRRVFNFDHTGAEIDYSYSSNPARVAADRILHFFEQRYRNDLTLARAKFQARIYWPRWVEWRDYCDALIPWDRAGDGVSVFITRFVANIGFAGDLSLASALNQVTGLSATIWQDDGSQLVFLPPSPRAPIHHFTPTNIIGGGVSISVMDLRRRANRFIVQGRDFEDEFLSATSVEPPEFTSEWEKRQRAIARVGEIRSEREFSSMTQSQMSRLITYRAQLEFHNPITYSLVGNAEAFRVLPGDFVTISHPEVEREYQLCLVTGMRKRSMQSSADEIGFNLQRIDGELYSDVAHRPRQEALTL